MVFYAYHGVYGAERELGQRFEVDVDMYLDVSAAAEEDDLNLAVNYVEVYEVVKKIIEGPPYNLIETLAQVITDDVLKRFSVKEVTVRVRKPSVALGGLLDYTEVELTRSAS